MNSETVPSRITAIKAGVANCYLLAGGGSFVLVDTGSRNRREVLVRELERVGCRPGDLRLVVLTHGDSDHSGNAAYVRTAYGAEIILHAGESEVVAAGDMRLSRSVEQKLARRVLYRTILPLLKLRKSDRFVADLCVEDGYDLSPFGLDAKIIALPGHSRGSIGVLTSAGDLFCGDLLMNRDKPERHFGIDDEVAFTASIERLRQLEIKTVYPGHGPSFPADKVLQIGV